MAAARAFGVEGVDGAVLERGQRGFQEAAFVERIGVHRHLHVHPVGHRQAVVDGGRRAAPVLVQLEADRAGATCSSSGRGRLTLPLPRSPGSSGRRRPPSIECICQGPGVQVVAAVPTAGPVPPPIMVVTPLISASSICCGQMKWMWVSTPPAVTIMPSPAMISVAPPMAIVTPGWMSGIAGLADGGDQAVLQADVGLDDAPVVDDDGVGDDRVHHLGMRALRLAHAVADHFAAAEFDFLAVDGVVLLDLDEQFGVGQADAVARGGAVHFGVGAAANRRHSQVPCGGSAPITRPLKP
jgi:hypothetical protein